MAWRSVGEVTLWNVAQGAGTPVGVGSGTHLAWSTSNTIVSAANPTAATIHAIPVPDGAERLVVEWTGRLDAASGIGDTVGDDYYATELRVVAAGSYTRVNGNAPVPGAIANPSSPMTLAQAQQWGRGKLLYSTGTKILGGTAPWPLGAVADGNVSMGGAGLFYGLDGPTARRDPTVGDVLGWIVEFGHPQGYANNTSGFNAAAGSPLRINGYKKVWLHLKELGPTNTAYSTASITVSGTMKAIFLAEDRWDRGSL